MKSYSSYELQQLSCLLKFKVSILDVAKQLNFTLIKKSSRYYSLQEHDSVIMDTQKNCFYRNSDSSKNARGSIVDFVSYFNNCSISESYNFLYDMIGGIESLDIYDNSSIGTSTTEILGPSSIGTSTTELILPEKDSSYRNIYAYLLKTRKIDNVVVQDFVARKMLYQDKNKNAVFVAYDNNNEVNYACKRGTNTYKRFVGDVSGSNYNQGFYINNHAKKLFISESVIDAMSYMTLLKRQGEDFHLFNYLCLTGTCKTDSLDYIVKTYPENEKYVIGLDHDTAGEKSTTNIQNHLIDYNRNIKIAIATPQTKDWNSDLVENLSLHEVNDVTTCTYVHVNISNPNSSTRHENSIKSIVKEKKTYEPQHELLGGTSL